jgi:hypothetical protein
MLEELKALPNWVCHGVDKVPLRIADGWPASPTNPTDWCSYEQAEAFMLSEASKGYGLGFVLTKQAGITCIDLDATEDESVRASQVKLYNQFNTYKEISPSGKGCHIWCYGSVETRKYSDKKVEVYSDARYITVTFNPLVNVPLANCQQLLEQLVASIDIARGSVPTPITPYESQPQILTDEQVVELIKASPQADIFYNMWIGKWDMYYTSQSEADLTMCNLISFYTSNKEQVARLFLKSSLGARKKAQRKDYLFHPVYGIVTKSFDQKIDPAVLANAVEIGRQMLERQRIEETVEESLDVWPKPEGLLGEIAEYIYQSAVFPSQQVAIAAAIGFMAGICGRAYNINNTGLNQYLVVLAATGQGKDALHTGIGRLSKMLTQMHPPFINFVGPSDVASPQGLIKRMVGSPSMYVIKGECGLWLQKLTDKNANMNETQLRGLMLELFTKSGINDTYLGVAYSDVKNTVPSIDSPALTLIGESTPQEFYRALDESNIAEGLVPRFSIISCGNHRPVYNEVAANVQPSPTLLQGLSTLVKVAIDKNMSRQCTIVEETTEARKFQLKYQKQCQNKLWEGGKPSTSPIAQIWNRAHLRLLRLAALMAVGKNPHTPMITTEDYKWAERIITHGVEALTNKFEAGEVGEESHYLEQVKIITNFLTKYYQKEFNQKRVEQMRCSKQMYDYHAVTFAGIHNSVMTLAAFRNDRNRAMAFRGIIDNLLNAGAIMKATTEQKVAWSKMGDIYVIVDPTALRVTSE